MKRQVSGYPCGLRVMLSRGTNHQERIGVSVLLFGEDGRQWFRFCGAWRQVS